ncbi:MAG: GNAT family N-acetyltransferase [Promethearchaeota archaeon]
MAELYHLERLREDQIEEASRVLGRAFQDDPAFIYIFPDPIEGNARIVNHCELMILTGIISGEVYITSSDIEGVAVWHPHRIKDHIINKPSKEIKQRLRKTSRINVKDPIYMERNGIFAEIVNSIQNEHANFPHWYLNIIGVDPIHQGKGYGSKLIKMKLAEIDEQNLPCYLHTEKERNVKIYEHFGFEVIDHAKIPNSELESWSMIRKKKKT